MPDSAMSVRPEAARDARRGALGGAVGTVTRTITVAAGVFGPGHLGELTRHVPFELVDAVLEQTGAVQRRLRALPSRVGVISFWHWAVTPSWDTRTCGRS